MWAGQKIFHKEFRKVAKVQPDYINYVEPKETQGNQSDWNLNYNFFL